MSIKVPPSLTLTAWLVIGLSLAAILIRVELGFAMNRLLAAGCLVIGFAGVAALFRAKQLLKSPFINNALITLGIIFLLADEFVPVWWLLGVGMVAALSKRLVRWRQQPIFNPAALALWLVSWVGVLATWWGVSFSPRFTDWQISGAVIVTLPIGLYLTYKYKKLAIAGSVWLSFFVTTALLEQRWPWSVTMEGTLFFLCLLMATEPKTSPNLRSQQFWFGGMIGFLAAALSKVSWLPSSYLTGLLLANAAFKTVQWWQSRTPGYD